MNLILLRWGGNNISLLLITIHVQDAFIWIYVWCLKYCISPVDLVLTRCQHSVTVSIDDAHILALNTLYLEFNTVEYCFDNHRGLQGSSSAHPCLFVVPLGRPQTLMQVKSPSSQNIRFGNLLSMLWDDKISATQTKYSLISRRRQSLSNEPANTNQHPQASRDGDSKGKSCCREHLHLG